MKMVTALTAAEGKEPHCSCLSESGDSHSWSLIWCQAQPQVGDPRPLSVNTSGRTRPHVLPCLPFPVSGSSKEDEETPAKKKKSGERKLSPRACRPPGTALCPVRTRAWSCLLVKTQKASPMSEMLVDFFIILKLDF